MGKIVSLIFGLFRDHKLKMLVFVTSTVFFILILFPYGDLLETITDRVHAATRANPVYFESNDLNLRILPLPGLEFEDVITETTSPALQLKASRVTVRPGILSLLRLRPSVSVVLEGFQNGNLWLNVAVRDKGSDGSKNIDFDVTTQNVALDGLASSLRLPAPIFGEMSGDIRTSIVCGTSELDSGCRLPAAPRGQIDLLVKDLKTSGGGPMQLPSLSFQVLRLKASMDSGKMSVTEAALGTNTDPISGMIRGEVDVSAPAGLGLVFGNYRLNMDLQMSPDLEKTLALVATYLRQYRTSSPKDPGRYRFSLSGSAAGGALPMVGPYDQSL